MARSDELQIDRPAAFLRRERRFQQVGRVALGLFVLGGVAGLFGDGPLSSTVAQAGDTHVRYERFGRMTSPTRVSITVQTAARDGEPVAIRMERAFVERLSMLEVRPTDALVGYLDEAALFEVPATGGRGHLELQYKCNDFGVLRTAIATGSGPPVAIWQLFYF